MPALTGFDEQGRPLPDESGMPQPYYNAPGNHSSVWPGGQVVGQNPIVRARLAQILRERALLQQGRDPATGLPKQMTHGNVTPDEIVAGRSQQALDQANAAGNKGAGIPGSWMDILQQAGVPGMGQ